MDRGDIGQESAPAAAPNDVAPRHQIQRMRHETRRRVVTVANVIDLTPRMRRIVFSSPDLSDFTSAGADDHVKLFIPAPEGGEPYGRDYTPRAFDNGTGSLTVDFAIHEGGPATLWARQAKVGGLLQLGGPRGSLIVPDDFDWYLFVADETGLPAIGRRLEQLRAGVPALTLVAVEDLAEAQGFATAAAWQPHWVTRASGPADDSERLCAALAGLDLPAGDGFVWIAAEAKAAKALRAHIVETRGHPIHWMRAAGYWQRGSAGVHENL